LPSYDSRYYATCEGLGADGLTEEEMMRKLCEELEALGDVAAA
jgi:hypothetical protein